MSDSALALAPVVERVHELQERIRQLQAAKLDARSIPTHSAIAELLPGGALQEGATYSVDRSLTLIMLLLAAPSAAGAWCGVVGVPEFGVEAAAGFGIDLDRLVLVPHPGEQWLAATAAVADALSVVVVRPPRRASDASISRLSARLRKRGATLLVLDAWPRDAWPHGVWPQSDAMLSITESSWAGIGDGHGHLQSREATVTVTSKTHGRPRSARILLPENHDDMRVR
ncbi:MAG: hypothetical protein KF801_09115 [Cryobacterium sp.]|nr:hypothetical protein [Cryobacterium sp.]